jgi:hypothetical protein
MNSMSENSLAYPLRTAAIWRRRAGRVARTGPSSRRAATPSNATPRVSALNEAALVGTLALLMSWGIAEAFVWMQLG